MQTMKKRTDGKMQTVMDNAPRRKISDGEKYLTLLVDTWWMRVNVGVDGGGIAWTKMIT